MKSDRLPADLNRDGGWAVGSSPSLVIVDQGTNPTIATGNLASGTVGYKFTEKTSAALGYRYYQTDYSDGGFIAYIAQSGLYTGVNFIF